MATVPDLPDREILQSWLRQVPGFADAQVDDLSLAEGGASNLTCCVQLANAPAAEICLRIQRDDGIFAPYDVLLEGEVIKRLAASDLPVPKLLAVEPDPSIFGGPFLVMEWIDAPHMGVAGDQADYLAYVNAVVAVHKTDWKSLGLDCLPVPKSAKAATLAQLGRMSARMEGFGCLDDPQLTKALSRLSENVPDDGEITFCQGDINIFNYLFRNKTVVGIVDWEEAFLGDCRADVGQLIALSHLKGEAWGQAEEAGFAVAYQGITGQPLKNLGYFRSLWLFYLAVIWHGWTMSGSGEPWYSLDQVKTALRRSSSDY